MPAYKDKKSNTWYCQFYYTDWKNIRKKKCKRGFRTKKEALVWEHDYQLKAKADMDMTLGAFVEVYYADKAGELKERTMRNKKYMIKTHILPYFGEKPMNSITPSDIIQWQNIMRTKGYSEAYLRMLQNQLTALFSHASKIYNLANNPCKKVKKMGKSDSRSLTFWTEEEYSRFIDTFEQDSRYYVLFETLFWTGCRIGELLALTKADIDFSADQISISKTYYRHECRDIITSPKTPQSIRTIDIPEFLSKELKEYTDKLYELPDEERIFPMVPEAVQQTMKRHADKAGVKRIRVHDLRHSHVAYLINQGVQPMIIKERLGHKDIGITLNTYGHLYPNEQKQVADLLDANRSR